MRDLHLTDSTGTIVDNDIDGDGVYMLMRYMVTNEDACNYNSLANDGSCLL